MINYNQQLVLGTVQFGLNYGISNNEGMTSDYELQRILQTALEKEIYLLDCAEAYGDSMDRIERYLPSEHAFKAVYKVTNVEKENPFHWNHLLKLNTFMFHRSEDLLSVKGQNIIEQLPPGTKIGISVYDEQEIRKVLSAGRKIDVIQLPINVFDQRMRMTGILTNLKNDNIEIHARSVFLQGLLLMNESDLPPFFAPIHDHFRKYADRVRESGLSPVQYCLAFIKTIQEIDHVIVGVNNHKQWLDIIQAYQKLSAAGIDFNDLGINDNRYIDPRKW